MRSGIHITSDCLRLHLNLGLAVLGLIQMQLPTVAAAAGAKHFASPQEASRALLAACESEDDAALVETLGSDATPLVRSGDAVADANVRRRFVALYNEKHELQSQEDGSMLLMIGADPWPLPFPIVRDADGYRFDVAAGQDEILNRRVGGNELAAMQATLAYTDAQREYYRSGVAGEPLRYAQKFRSSPGKRDGLYWPTEGAEPLSPLGELFAAAQAEGYAVKGDGAPFHGYYFRILAAQGPDARGGAYDYVVRDQMIGGFALIAFPAEYGVSGVMSFLVNHDGILFEKDLGANTAQLAGQIRVFNPGAGWRLLATSEVDGD